jgi:hypothetical protein
MHAMLAAFSPCISVRMHVLAAVASIGLGLASSLARTGTNKLKACGTFNFSLAVSVIKRQ